MTEIDGLIRMESPIGRLEIVSRGGAIVGITSERDGVLPRDGFPEKKAAVLGKAITQLGEYFAGKRREFDLPVKLTATPFPHAGWDSLTTIPFGAVRSYGDVGMATGRATAGRAVGGAVGAHPVPIIVPCHRVLASDSRIPGYSGIAHR